MKKMIVTADDYGMSKAVNTAISEGIREGLITSTNVMTNMCFFEGLPELKSLAKDVSVGLHWTLTAGYPVADKDTVKTLVDANGRFFSYNEFRERYKKKLISDAEIRNELSAQYSKFRELTGYEPDYWNTHQNVHVVFGLYHLFVDVANSLKIFKMRNHQRLYVKGRNGKMHLKWRLMEPFKRNVLKKWQAYSASKNMKYPDGIIINLDAKDRMDLQYTFSNIAWGNHETGEFVIHPATACDSEYFGKITENRINEYKQFTDKATKDAIESAQITLISYEAL